MGRLFAVLSLLSFARKFLKNSCDISMDLCASLDRWRQELFGTITQCLNLEQEIHHTASKLCILALEPLK